MDSKTSMRGTARTSTKSANAVDYENSVYAVDSEKSHKLGVCSGQRDLAQTQSMRRTPRTSTKSANAVDYENSVDAVDCENSVYAVDCENSVYAVDCENSVYGVDSKKPHKSATEAVSEN